MPQIYKVKLASVPLADGLKWKADPSWIYTEKLDGQWDEKAIGESVLVGEMVGARFTAFDIVTYRAVDIRSEPLRNRLELLREFNVPIVRSGDGGEFLQSVLASGGEGIVAKNLECGFGKQWLKCKRVETFDCQVIERHERKRSIHLSLNGIECGWCALQGINFERVKVGDVVEINAFSLTANGKLREPRFVRLRPDKI